MKHIFMREGHMQPEHMHENIEALLKTLHLTSEPAVDGEDRFSAPSQYMPHGRVFGGQVLSQSLIAASKTIQDDRPVHSLHGYFLRAGDITKPIEFSVDRIHDGRSFSTRRTQAYQDGLPILSMIASFQDVDPGLNHQIEMPTDIPAPESLPTTEELLGQVDHPVAQYWATQRPFDLRHVEAPIYMSVEGPHVAHQAVWMKALSPLPDDPMMHRAALAYASDYTILEPIYRKHGIPWATPGLKAASLDHAMWFHRFGRVDEWMLYVQESPSAQGGRGLSFGRIYSREGVLLASVAQEGMVRVPGMEN
jgi:acyl-CoA thioesterase II